MVKYKFKIKIYEYGEKQNGKRKSNFELLRIIAIFLIILHHYFIHGTSQLDNSITFNLILSKILNIGRLANHIFIL